MAVTGNTLILVKGKEQWTPRAAMNFSKSFTVNGIPERLMVTLEGYYNGAGYDSRIFEDTAHYPSAGEPQSFMGYTVSIPDTLTKLEFFTRNGLYKTSQHATYYAALFSTFSRFITTDMALSFNAIGNIAEQCAMLAGGLTYKDLRDFSLGLMIIGNVGPDKTEYTYTGSALSVQMTAAITF